MTVTCKKCGKAGTLYYAKLKGHEGKIYYNKYVRHVAKTGRKGEAIQTTCYNGTATKQEYLDRPTKRVIDTIESLDLKDFNAEQLTSVKKYLESLANSADKVYAKTRASFLRRVIVSIERELKK